MKTTSAILYSFRRCPYAIRARLAIQSSGIRVQLREIVLSEKAPELLISSPKGTVPVLVSGNNVIDESLEIMSWALSHSDPEAWLKIPDVGYDWISRNDRQFKAALDHIKYSPRFSNLNLNLERETAAKFLNDLDLLIADSSWMFGEKCSLADMAILPFVRQFYNINNDWFDAQGWQNLRRWLTSFLGSTRFNFTMAKYDKWISGDPIVLFPGEPKLFSSQRLTV